MRRTVIKPVSISTGKCTLSEKRDKIWVEETFDGKDNGTGTKGIDDG